VEALQDLDGFSHIILIYVFHRSTGYSLKVTPYLETQQRGLFATRYPARPNPIGLSVVRLNRIEDNMVYILDVDMLDGTPLLDIKPFIPEVDNRENTRIGWLADRVTRMNEAKSDGRAD
jgi:tRNA-Thr(GGU) m(6)t(6)A37 methyltransferase TsaA